MDKGSSHGKQPEVERFARLNALFDEARSLEGDARRAFLERVQADDPGLARELLRLLGLDQDETGFLGAGADVVDPQLMQGVLEDELGRREPVREPIPESIGPYRPERVLGRGGMGTVFLAHRADGDFEQRVAIKILRPDLHDQELTRRFRAERSILAGLQHPNIAALVDGGTLPDGRPYVVMEYVEGSTLVDHAREHELTTRQRIELFRKVCEGVAHAHRSLVVHRDLKPSNILVTPHGEPKLVDFGIAKLLDPDRARHSLAVTSTGLMLLTPEYAAPEQVRGGAITTASDVYALGAVLYELLSGLRAHRFVTTWPTELERVICEEDPEAPSTAVVREEDVPLQRRTRLSRELAGDLDNIVLMALRKEPERRYGSVAELSEDLRRYLEGLPVSARKDTWRYRSSKFVRRNTLLVGAALLGLVLVTGFAVAMAVQAGRLARQRNIAQRESEVASEVSEFLVGLFRMAEPEEALGREVRARELLDVGSRRIAFELDTGSDVRASLMDVMGRAYHALGLVSEATPLLERALELRAVGPEHERKDAWVTSLMHLGTLRFDQGNYEESERLLRQALEVSLTRFPAQSLEVARARFELAGLLLDKGDNDEALELAREGLQVRRNLVPSPDARLADGLSAVGQVRERRAEFEQAEELFLESQSMRADLFGGKHPDCSKSERELGYLYLEMGRYPESIAAFEKALSIDRSIVGEEHPDVAADLFGLAMALDNSGNLERAEQIYRDVLEYDETRLGRHPLTALALNNLANVLSERGRFDEADAKFKQALQIQEELLPAGHQEIATTHSNMGVNWNRRGEPAKGEPFVREALRLRREIFPPEHPTILTTLSILATLLYEQGHYEEAEKNFREILETRRRVLGTHPHTAGSIFSVAIALQRQGKLEETEAMYRECVELYRQTVAPDSLELARPLSALGRTLLEQERADEAEPFLREALRVHQHLLGRGHRARLHTELDLARCLRELGRLDEARVLFGGILELIDEPGAEDNRQLDGFREAREEIAAGAQG